MECLQVERSRSEERVKIHPLRHNSQAGWTDKEDLLLAEAVNKYQEKHWRDIAKCMPNRTYIQCYRRWEEVLNPALNKSHWTKEDDNRLVKLVEEHGVNNWSHIATFFTGRRGKQCRERWHGRLNPAVKRGGWTKEEERTIARLHAEYGNKWTKIATFLPGRNGDSVRKYWYVKRMSDKSFTIKNISERPLVEDSLFASVANVGNGQTGRRYVPFLDKQRPSGSSRSVLPHLQTSSHKKKQVFADLACSQP